MDNDPQVTETPQTEVAPAPTTPEVAPVAEPTGRFVPAARFDAVVAQKYEAIRNAEAATARARELEQRLQASEQARQTPPPQLDANGQPIAPQQRQTAQPSPPDIDRLANLRAEQIRFTERCNESVAQGRAAHPDFDAAVDALRQVAPTIDGNGRPMLPQTFVEAALATGKAHDVLYALGKDQTEADRIMSLANEPMRLAVEIAKYASKFETKPSPEADPIALAERAKALPDPIKPRVGVGRGLSVKDMGLDDPNLPIEEFMARRNKEASTLRRSNGRFR